MQIKEIAFKQKSVTSLDRVDKKSLSKTVTLNRDPKEMKEQTRQIRVNKQQQSMPGMFEKQ